MTPDYFLSEPQVFSLQDLVAVKAGQLGDRLRQLVENALHHVDNCLVSTVLQLQSTTLFSTVFKRK